MENPAMTNEDIIGCLVEFVSKKQFLFFAPVSRTWVAAWGQRPTLTRFVTPDTSLSQMQYSFTCGEVVRGSGTCMRLAQYGKLQALQCARENDVPSDHRTCNFAARYGHLAVLKWARQSGCPWESMTCACAAGGGFLAVLR